MKALSILITSKCNFACKTCFGGFERGYDLPLNLLKKILNEIKYYGYNTISVTGGEPCLHQEFQEVVKLIIHSGMNFMFTTNGYFPQKYKFIIDNYIYKKHLIRISLSLDGATKEIHDYIRRIGSYKRVTATIKSYSSCGIYTIVSVCLNKINKHQIEPIILLSEQLGAKQVEFIGMVDNGFNTSLVLNSDEKLECYNRIKELSKKSHAAVGVHSSLQFRDSKQFCDYLGNLSSLAVNPKGEILFCGCLRHNYSIGDLNKTTFKKVLTKYRKIAFFLKKLRKEMIKKNKIIQGFNSCEYCNFLLKEINK